MKVIDFETVVFVHLTDLAWMSTFISKDIIKQTVVQH